MAASAELFRGEYDSQSANYDDSITTTPLGILETQLLDRALGDCAGLAVLDLGGGSGVRARQALARGAAWVDVVDLSPGMLRAGQARARAATGGDDDDDDDDDNEERIGWHEGDVSRPLDDQQLPLLRPAYDLVMANWVMDTAAGAEELEGMWANVGARLRPGGRYVGTRGGDPNAPAARDPKYGIVLRDHRPVPGGFRYRFSTTTTTTPGGNNNNNNNNAAAAPLVDLEGVSLEASYSGSTELQEKYGLRDVETVPYESAEIVRGDPEFWELFLQNPHMAVVTARKE